MFGWLFNKKGEREIPETPLVVTNKTGKDPIEHVFDVVKAVCVKYIDESEYDFTGLSEKDIQKLEQANSFTFPKAYRLFLKRFAGKILKIYDGQSYNLKGIASAQEVSRDLLEQDEFTLPYNHFAFSQWQGYNFYYFIHSGSDDPETFLYVEGGGDDINPTPPSIYPYGSFTNWVIELAKGSLKLYERLDGYQVEKGIQILEDLQKSNSRS